MIYLRLTASLRAAERERRVRLLEEPRWRWSSGSGWGRGRGTLDAQDLLLEPVTGRDA